tara:strand:+ start:261 stop:443 length:183 start_codon:yes stop_codon:yes gene_type:complete
VSDKNPSRTLLKKYFIFLTLVIKTNITAMKIFIVLKMSQKLLSINIKKSSSKKDSSITSY